MISGFENSFVKKDFWWENLPPSDKPYNHRETLSIHFKEFFNESQLNGPLLKQNLLAYQLRKNPPLVRRSLDLFKSLYPFSYRCVRSSCSDHVWFEKIKKDFGRGITAHGVEEAKGGPYNLLLMALMDRVQSPKAYWGSLVDGSPNISPVPHGPYYLVYEVAGWLPKGSAPNFINFDQVEFVLVPFPQIKEELLTLAKSMVEDGLWDDAESRAFGSKVIDFETFYQKLSQNLTPTDEAIQHNLCAPATCADHDSLENPSELAKESLFKMSDDDSQFQFQELGELPRPVGLERVDTRPNLNALWCVKPLKSQAGKQVQGETQNGKTTNDTLKRPGADFSPEQEVIETKRYRKGTP